MLNLDGNKWSEVDGKLYRKFEFINFVEALDFVNKVGEIAEKEQHHPDITFGWGYAEITLFTHSEHKITDKDVGLASMIDGLI